MWLAAAISALSVVLVAIVGEVGRRRLNQQNTQLGVIEVNTNHRLDSLIEEVRALREEKDAVAAVRLAEAQAASPLVHDGD